MNPRRRLVLRVGAAGVVAAGLAGFAGVGAWGTARRAWAADAPAAGSGSFDTQDFDWTDGARQRPVPVRL